MEITVVKAVCVLFCLVLVVLVTGCGGGGTTTTMAPEPKAVKPVTFSTEVGYNSAKFADSIVFTLDNNTDVSRAVTLKSKTVESKETTVRIIDGPSGEEYTFSLSSSLGTYHQEFDSTAIWDGSKWVELSEDPRLGVTQIIPPRSSLKIMIAVSKG